MASDKLDTGTGGFPIDGKAQTYDVGGPDTEPSKDTYTPGAVAVDSTVKDLSKGTKKTLAEYLSKTTMGQTPSSGGTTSNQYPIKHSTGDSPVDLSLKDKDGYVAPLTNTNNPKQPHFVDVVGGDGRSLKQTSLNVIRGAEKPSTKATQDGNVLLKNAVEPPASAPVPPARGEVNVGKLKDGSPVKFYTTSVVGTVPETLFNSSVNLRTKSTTVPSTDAAKANYLSKVTKGDVPSSPTTVDNKFPVEHSATVSPSTLSLNTEGYTTPPTVTSKEQPHFSDIETGRSYDATSLNILRGREKPSTTNKVDGNELLLKSVDAKTGLANPPAPGTVNTTALSSTSPVLPYTDKVLGKNFYGDDREYLDEDITSFRNKITLSSYSQYLGKLTKDGPIPMKGNVYSVDGTAEGQLPNEEKLLTVEGLPTPPHASSNSAKFVGDNVLSSRSTAAVRLQNLSRGRSFGNKTDGNTLLLQKNRLDQKIDPINPSSDGGSLPTVSTKTAASSLDKNIIDYYGNPSDLSRSVIFNRFNPNNRFDTSVTPFAAHAADKLNTPELKDQTTHQSTSQQLENQLFAKRYKLGSYSPEEGSSRSVTFGQLAQVGNALTRRAGLELGATNGGSNPTNGTAQAKDLLPGISQLGIMKIEKEVLEARSVLESLPGNIDSDLIINPAAFSWGSLNNVNDQFSGISAIGMQLLAVALVIGLAVAFTVIFLAFKIMGTQDREPNLIDDAQRYPYGASRASNSGGDYNSISGILSSIIAGRFNLWAMLGIASTRHDTASAMAVGVLGFFGVNAPSTSSDSLAFDAAKAAGKLALSVTASPGYYTVMARNISRSFLIIFESFQALGKAFGSGLTSGIKQLLELISVFRSSKFFKSVDVFCRLGDTIITLEEKSRGAQIFDSKTNTEYTRWLSDIDRAGNGEAVKKSRLNVDGGNVNPLTLAWASYRSPDLLLLPANIVNIRTVDNGKELGTPSLFSNIEVNSNKNDIGGMKYGGPYVVPTENTARISTETRELLEDALEAEYVPFYVHDVRTNEILSFHAFLTSLSDGYTASYDSSEGFGRVEPIKVYKGTTRKIDFSFMIVATSPKDFDYMWTKINKLTTMVYPQFSEGRSLVTADNNYSIHVPFSQTIQASPLVRVRIGDLIRSNYSKFGLARLFGYGSSGTKFGVEMPSSSEDNLIGNLLSGEAYKKALQIAGTRLVMVSGELGQPVPKPTFPPIPTPVPSKKTVPVTVKTLPPGLILRVVKVDNDKAICSVEGSQHPDDLTNVTPEQIRNTEKYYGNQDPGLGIIGKCFSIPVSNLALARSELKKLIKESKFVDYHNGVKTFMNDNLNEGNAVVRSFRSSGGKGLAGFIESMSFDWYDRTTWEIGRGTSDEENTLGRRAPKMCKVTVSFSPIHDITPGIDHMGMNRAPVYPIGPYAINDARNGPSGEKK